MVLENEQQREDLKQFTTYSAANLGHALFGDRAQDSRQFPV
jgi:hypothetical protein